MKSSDFSWIGKTFGVIDDDFTKVNDSIDTLKENIQLDIKKKLKIMKLDTLKIRLKLEMKQKILIPKREEKG